MSQRDIIVLGASAGGIEALQQLVAALPADLPAALLVTLHLFERSETTLPQILHRAGPLPAVSAQDGQPIEPGRIYVAPPDYHLILRPGSIQLGHGPKENLQRPCINAMFRSAAVAYGPRVIGVLLTGMLDDGAAGLWEIQQRGGVTVVQDPEEAAYRSMPDSAIRGFPVHYILGLSEMGRLLPRLVQGDGDPKPARDVPAEHLEAAQQTCPECGGVMQKARLGRLSEYRCHIGHRFGWKTMIAEKSGVIERAISQALAQTEELLQLLEATPGQRDAAVQEPLRREIQSRREHARQLRKLLEQQIISSLEA
jgi:two-component system, chemotaxis family, protein-glutamate methylesterase/glutaminase